MQLWLYIFWLLHQTTTYCVGCSTGLCCISFDSYIKPQPTKLTFNIQHVVYLLTPTSNHNYLLHLENVRVVVYLLTPTSNHNLLFNQESDARLYIFWLLHQTTTACSETLSGRMLYIFWLLHQTTTIGQAMESLGSCISFDSYIKPQPSIAVHLRTICCISFDSYIKPQLPSECLLDLCVVYLLTPTSNHNWQVCLYRHGVVVYLLTPTSNHN